MENRLGLSTKSLLFPVVTAFTLGEVRGFTCFVLGYLVLRVFLAFLAESSFLFRCVNHFLSLINIYVLDDTDHNYNETNMLFRMNNEFSPLSCSIFVNAYRPLHGHSHTHALVPIETFTSFV